MPSPRWFGLVPVPRRPFRPTLETLDTRDLPSVSIILPVGNLQAVAGTPFSGTVAVLHAAVGGRKGSAVPRKLHATINWGDGHTTAGTIVRTDAFGDLAVTGTNTFPARQTFPVTVTVRDGRDHSTVSTLSLVSVAGMTPPSLPDGLIGSDGVSVDGTLALTPVAVNATTGQRFTGVVGVVHDGSGLASDASSLSAVVDWGDGSPVDLAAVQQAAPGIFQIVGSHSYSFAGSGAVQVWVEDVADGRSATAAANLTVTGGTPAPQTTPAAAVVLATTPPASASAPGSVQAPQQPLLNGQSRSFDALDTSFVWEMTGSGRYRSWQVRPGFPVWRTNAGRVR